MRTLFYIGDRTWSGGARALLSGAVGLAARGHQATVVCCPGSEVERRAAAAGADVVPIPPANVASDAWWLRKVLQDRFIETAFVGGEREQLVVSSATRLAERGAVLRRIPAFEPTTFGATARLAARMAATGLVFATAEEAREGERFELPIAPAVVPIGIDPAMHADVQPADRREVGLPSRGLLIACVYEPGGRFRLATAMRTLALLAPRHPEIHMAVLGPGSLDDDLRMHASALGVTPLVTFMGEREDHARILRAADVGWVVANRDEGAFALLDFMAMRIPTLAERGTLAQHYAADGITGLCLAPRDSAHTASAVASFLANAEGRAAMGNAGFARVQREFPLAAMVDGYERAASEAGDRSRWAAR